MRRLMPLFVGITLLSLMGCQSASNYDYTEFRTSNPTSILVLPAINETTDIDASDSFISQVTFPLSEAGYYVFPINVVKETFRQNGLTLANEIHRVNLKKLQQIFGTDAVLYLNITQYGTQYQVINSETRVSANARLVDARTGKQLWQGSASASNHENSQANGNIIAMLAGAVISQVIDTMTDESHHVAAITSTRLLSAGQRNGILYGPRSPRHNSVVPQ